MPADLGGHPLAIAVSAAVPLLILEYRAAGGPTDDDRERARRAAQVVAEKGDVLQYRGRSGEAAAVFNALVDGLAVLAFCPGGVRFCGHHFEAVATPKGSA